MLSIIVALSAFHAGRDVSPRCARGIRAHANMKNVGFVWEPIAHDSVSRIMDKYFGADVRTGNRCELFLINGVPAASMVYSAQDRRGRPIVDAFHINTGFVTMFDAGAAMRKELFKRYGTVKLDDAENKEVFLNI